MRLALALAAAIVLAVAAPAARGDEAEQLVLQPGERLPICGRFAACPLMSATCDDPNVARAVDGKAGPELQAGAPGTTLCGFVGSGFYRRVVRVTVKPPKP